MLTYMAKIFTLLAQNEEVICLRQYNTSVRLNLYEYYICGRRALDCVFVLLDDTVLCRMPLKTF